MWLKVDLWSSQGWPKSCAGDHKFSSGGAADARPPFVFGTSDNNWLADLGWQMNVEGFSRGARPSKTLNTKCIFKMSPEGSEGRTGREQETSTERQWRFCVRVSSWITCTHTKTHKQSNSAVKESQNGSSWKCQRYTFNANEAFCSVPIFWNELWLIHANICFQDKLGLFFIIITGFGAFSSAWVFSETPRSAMLIKTAFPWFAFFFSSSIFC